MDNQEQKLSKFVQAINRDAENRRARILDEAEEFRRQELEKAEDAALTEAYHLIQDEIARMRRRIRHESSTRMMEKHRAVLLRREEITKEVFSEAKKRVRAFAQSEDYAQYLTKCAQEAASMMADSPVIIRLRADDLKSYQELISSAFQGDCSFHASDDIQLGGMLIECPEKGLVADETLDSRLDGERTWFAAHSGLSVV